MGGMMKKTMIAAALGSVFLLATKRAGGGSPIPPPSLTPRQDDDRLANWLVYALSYGDKPEWDKVSEKCRKVGREDLPGHVREKNPELAEQFDRA